MRDMTRGNALRATNEHLRGSEPGRIIEADEVAQGANQRWQAGLTTEDVVSVFEEYEREGWVNLDRPTGGTPRVIEVTDLFLERSDATNMEMLDRGRRADRDRVTLEEQRRDLAPVVNALGLSPESDVETLKRQLADHGMAVKGIMPNLLTWGVRAIVWHPRPDNRGGSSGLGASESEAVCHAAALEFLGLKREGPAEA